MLIGAYKCTFNSRNKEIFGIPNNAPSFSCIKLNLGLRFREMYLKSIKKKHFRTSLVMLLFSNGSFYDMVSAHLRVKHLFQRLELNFYSSPCYVGFLI